MLNIDTIAYNKGDLLDIFRYAYLNYGTDLNLLTYRTDSKLFTFNCAGGVLRTRIGNDTVDYQSKTISTIYLNPKLNFQFYESNRLDFNFGVGMYAAWAISSLDSISFAQMGVNATHYIFSKTPYWAQIEQSINLHPGGNKHNSIFIRATQHLSIRQNYFTFQIGYSTRIDKILKL